jgi:hypothetical protein
MVMPCLFCGGDIRESDHAVRCDGQQGHFEAAHAFSVPDDVMPGPTMDLPAARMNRDDGIRVATAAARKPFIDAAYAALLEVLAQRDRFIIDDVWQAMGPTAPQTHERRAIAAVIMRARRERLITPSGEYRSSAQPQCHANPRQIWQRVSSAKDRSL